MTSSRMSIVAVLLAASCGSKSTSDTVGTGTAGAGSGTGAGTGDPASVPAGAPASMLDGSGSAVSDDAAIDAANAEFVRKFFSGPAANLVKVRCSSNKMRLTLDGVMFDTDHDNIKAGGDDLLAQVKKVGVDPYPNATITVEGHTDDVGADAHNDDLSRRRAKTVADWMQWHGVAQTRLKTMGYGKRWPRVPNTSDDNRAKNRRVELVVNDGTAGQACTGVLPGAPVVLEAGSGTMIPESHHGKVDVTHDQASGSSAPAVAFSFLYNDTTDDWGHACVSFDPAWVPSSWGSLGDMRSGYSQGKFVASCPTGHVLATCDRKGVTGFVETYYEGTTDAKLAMRKVLCGAPSRWSGREPKIDKAGADPGDYAFVCDSPGTHQCLEFRKDASATMIEQYKLHCPTPGPSVCPASHGAEKQISRCEGASGMIQIMYDVTDDQMKSDTFKAMCGDAKWSHP